MEEFVIFMTTYNWSKWEFVIGAFIISLSILSTLLLSVLAVKSWMKPQYKAQRVSWVDRITGNE